MTAPKKKPRKKRGTSTLARRKKFGGSREGWVRDMEKNIKPHTSSEIGVEATLL
jgi:hypothetical protein